MNNSMSAKTLWKKDIKQKEIAPAKKNICYRSPWVCMKMGVGPCPCGHQQIDGQWALQESYHLYSSKQACIWNTSTHHARVTKKACACMSEREREIERWTWEHEMPWAILAHLPIHVASSFARHTYQNHLQQTCAQCDFIRYNSSINFREVQELG